MTTKSIKLTLPETLYEEGTKLVKDFGYSNLQDLTVEGLRIKIIELKKQQALLNLKKSFRSVKPKPRLTKEQKEKIAESSLERTEKIMKKYNLEDIKI